MIAGTLIAAYVVLAYVWACAAIMDGADTVAARAAACGVVIVTIALWLTA